MRTGKRLWQCSTNKQAGRLPDTRGITDLSGGCSHLGIAIVREFSLTRHYKVWSVVIFFTLLVFCAIFIFSKISTAYEIGCLYKVFATDCCIIYIYYSYLIRVINQPTLYLFVKSCELSYL